MSNLGWFTERYLWKEETLDIKEFNFVIDTSRSLWLKLRTRGGRNFPKKKWRCSWIELKEVDRDVDDVNVDESWSWHISQSYSKLRSQSKVTRHIDSCCKLRTNPWRIREFVLLHGEKQELSRLKNNDSTINKDTDATVFRRDRKLN